MTLQGPGLGDLSTNLRCLRDEPKPIHSTRICILCGESNTETRFEHPPYTVIRCRGCGLVEIDPKPVGLELECVYQDAYFRSPSAQHRGYKNYPGEKENYLRTFRRRLDAVRQYVQPSGDVLEVGCACGFFLAVLREAGWAKLYAVELSTFAVNEARLLLGPSADIREGFLRNQNFGKHFDTVFMWDVIEHMPDPLTELRHIHGLLRPGGHLILETQDVGSLTARLAGKRWHMYKFPEHLYHFDRRTVRIMLEKCGFTLRTITRKAAGKYLSGDFIKERIVRYGKPLRMLVAPFRSFLKHLYVNLGDEMIVVARRD